MNIVIRNLSDIEKHIIYDYVNDEFFLVEMSEKDKNTLKEHWMYKSIKGKSIYAVISLICFPFFWIIKDIDIPVIVFHFFAFCLRKPTRKLFFDPQKEKLKGKPWEHISHEQASLNLKDISVIPEVCMLLAMLGLFSFGYYSDALEGRFITIIGIISIGAIFFAITNDWLIWYKVDKKLKKLRVD